MSVDAVGCSGMSVVAAGYSGMFVGCSGMSVDAAGCIGMAVDAVECSGMSANAVGCSICSKWSQSWCDVGKFFRMQLDAVCGSKVYIGDCRKEGINCSGADAVHGILMLLML